MDAEASRAMWVYSCSSEYSSFQEWTQFTGAIEGYPALEDNPFFGKTYPPLLSDQGTRYCTMYDGGEGPLGMSSASIHVTDSHPLVSWIASVLQRKDNTEELHAGGTSPHSEYRKQD